ncbi:tRNA (N(6)-L-threonylcarbamoyladenosine(37)-C(2))-methylthiotransferase MtaB [Methylopila jiangsuensis]|uniref:tRNA (N(6)-L-threonylcarbamoyladenosine(37)-C(2))-methylthiotransferase MtaB n=1 Tax=Methylopila jiangsuensis TaxID=586230 RepID=A0A9W6N3R8_9HYPH|nr:tRNA (N(6)-L-threonylcarbamoyladenosine(37)-C(2))-methylthiotransferase MtaB [Methylopila jiangsuensis]MDR6285275.1 threonylcarbamoyladenosine tRNA methylthiotransferase MtaB [Methylopila jiangsuensis]GLK77334.1 tRNA (N(6)-L-threonylcarbamoyladenosine(37)-C(2))-methylthiotransferase MtaB [Methylopila jiangsuensis]
MGPEIVTFGCRLNAVDSEAIRAHARGRDDIVVVNACAVTAEAGRQARQAARRAARARPDAEIVVTGCGAQIEPQTYAAMPEVSRVVGAAARQSPETWARRAGPDAPRVAVADVFAERSPPPPPPAAADILLPRAFVAVQTGCDHRCTFCVIPFGRGASRSTPKAQVIAEVRRVLALGAREAVLTGVDLTSWGHDLGGGEERLGDLVRAVLKAVPELPRLRLSSLDAVEIDPALMRALAEEERLAPHLHLSLQSGDDLILKRMKRRHSRADAERFCDAARRARPDIAFGCDVIAGFPTETEAMASNTRAALEACGIAYAHVFPFSARPETPAARMPQLAPEVVKARAAALRELGAALLARHLDARLGRRIAALSEGKGLARAADFTAIRLARAVPRGETVILRAATHDGRALIAA